VWRHRRHIGVPTTNDFSLASIVRYTNMAGMSLESYSLMSMRAHSRASFLRKRTSTFLLSELPVVRAFQYGGQAYRVKGGYQKDLVRWPTLIFLLFEYVYHSYDIPKIKMLSKEFWIFSEIVKNDQIKDRRSPVKVGQYKHFLTFWMWIHSYIYNYMKNIVFLGGNIFTQVNALRLYNLLCCSNWIYCPSLEGSKEFSRSHNPCDINIILKNNLQLNQS
jgi:hypothetical protein